MRENKGVAPLIIRKKERNTMIKTTGEQVLLYGIKDIEKERKIKSILIRMGVKIRNISTDLCGEKVGYLAGIRGFEPTSDIDNTRLPVEEEMLIMRGFTGPRLDTLLKEMRKANARVNLKAIITEHNQHWNLFELYEELKKEHESMNS